VRSVKGRVERKGQKIPRGGKKLLQGSFRCTPAWGGIQKKRNWLGAAQDRWQVAPRRVPDQSKIHVLNHALGLLGCASPIGNGPWYKHYNNN